jgi:hypothetical protein
MLDFRVAAQYGFGPFHDGGQLQQVGAACRQARSRP